MEEVLQIWSLILSTQDIPTRTLMSTQYHRISEYSHLFTTHSDTPSNVWHLFPGGPNIEATPIVAQ